MPIATTLRGNGTLLVRMPAAMQFLPYPETRRQMFIYERETSDSAQESIRGHQRVPATQDPRCGQIEITAR
jgi:hypothetical protein